MPLTDKDNKKKGKLLENVPLVDIHSAGKAVGSINEKNIYVNLGIPGETVDLRLDRRVRGFYAGYIERIRIPSPARVLPFCKHFGACGGCDWQHMEYDQQLHLKKQILLNALQKYKIPVPFVNDVAPSEQKQFYRNKIEYAFASLDFSSESSTYKNVLGFHPLDDRRQVIDIRECWLQRQPSRKICETIYKIAIQKNLSFYHYYNKTGFLRNLVIRTSSADEVLVLVGFTRDDPEKRIDFLTSIQAAAPEITSLMFTVLTSPEKGYADGDIVPFNGPGYLNEHMGTIRYRISPRTFYQPNAMQANRIYQKILAFASFKKHELVYDLYSGAGTIACFIAAHVGKVIGIEGSVDAVNDAVYNAELNGISNAHFICGDVLQTFTPDFITKYGNPDTIILDPPRSGTLIEIKKTIIQAAPDKIIYVSCNPVSLAFDLTMLITNYHIIEIQPFDMFPHTHHLETLVLMEKNEGT
jgi:23S rRNA (uracil1939-C5)-methyltransferase